MTRRLPSLVITLVITTLIAVGSATAQIAPQPMLIVSSGTFSAPSGGTIRLKSACGDVNAPAPTANDRLLFGDGVTARRRSAGGEWSDWTPYNNAAAAGWVSARGPRPDELNAGEPEYSATILEPRGEWEIEVRVDPDAVLGPTEQKVGWMAAQRGDRSIEELLEGIHSDGFDEEAQKRLWKLLNERRGVPELQVDEELPAGRVLLSEAERGKELRLSATGVFLSQVTELKGHLSDPDRLEYIHTRASDPGGVELRDLLKEVRYINPPVIEAVRSAGVYGLRWSTPWRGTKSISLNEEDQRMSDEWTALLRQPVVLSFSDLQSEPSDIFAFMKAINDFRRRYPDMLRQMIVDLGLPREQFVSALATLARPRDISGTIHGSVEKPLAKLGARDQALVGRMLTEGTLRDSAGQEVTFGVMHRQSAAELERYILEAEARTHEIRFVCMPHDPRALTHILSLGKIRRESGACQTFTVTLDYVDVAAVALMRAALVQEGGRFDRPLPEELRHGCDVAINALSDALREGTTTAIERVLGESGAAFFLLDDSQSLDEGKVNKFLKELQQLRAVMQTLAGATQPMDGEGICATRIACDKVFACARPPVPRACAA